MHSQALDWMNERGLPNQECPSCGPTQWLTDERLVALPMLTLDEDAVDRNAYMAAIACTCLTCAQAIFFSIHVMGIDGPYGRPESRL